VSAVRDSLLFTSAFRTASAEVLSVCPIAKIRQLNNNLKELAVRTDAQHDDNGKSSEPTVREVIHTPSTNQHYVPQFLLRNFASGRNKQIYVFEKLSQKTFRTSVRNVAAESGFYDYQVDGEVLSVDPALQDLENVTKDIISKIIRGRSLREIDDRTRKNLAVFAATQLFRTEAHRKRWSDVNTKLRQTIIAMGGDPEKVEGFGPISEEDLRVQMISTLPSRAVEGAAYILEKSWMLLGTSSQKPFCTSDNPITMSNTLNQNSHIGTLGLAVPGIEIYFPLSKTLCLGFFCPTIEELIRKSQKRASSPGNPGANWCMAFDGLAPLEMEHDNVTYLNSLQVINAERYVFLGDSDFSLVSKMLQNHPELKDGPRFQVNHPSVSPKEIP